MDQTIPQNFTSSERSHTMSHRVLAGLIIALVASSGLSPVQLSARAEAAQPAPAPTVKVELIDVAEVVPDPQGGPSVLVPATLCPNQIDWLVGALTTPATRVLLTANAIDLTRSTQPELTDGEIALQVCERHRQDFPKEECDVAHAARWNTEVFIPDISRDSTPTFGTSFQSSVFGFRFQYVPVPGSGFERATSASFNIYRGACQ